MTNKPKNPAAVALGRPRRLKTQAGANIMSGAMIPNDTITIQQASVFFFAFFTICVGLGVWLGCMFSHWRIKKLLSRIELLKLENEYGRPVRS